MSEQDIELNVETGEELVNQDQPDQNEEQEEHDDGLAAGESDNDEAEEAEGDTDEEREAIRERRREERRHRKQAQKEREDTLRRELAARDSIINEMREKLSIIEQRNTGSELAQIENGKKQAAQAYQFFKDQIRIAGEQGNHAAVADATEKMIQSQRRFDDLARIEQTFKQRQSAPQALDPRLVNQAQEWMSRNKWYDPAARDQDSRVVMTLDQQLAQEGWDPTTKEYWQELDIRVKKYLPHKNNGGKISGTKPKSVVTGGARESSGPANLGTYKLSSERVKALKDAGLWDDPKQRADAIKRFREYDKQNKA